MTSKTDKPSAKIRNAGDVLRDVAYEVDIFARNVAGMPMPDTVGIRDVDSWKKFGVWLREVAGVGAKYSGAGMLFAMEYVMRLINAMVVDNVALRKLADAYERVKISQKKPQGFVEKVKKTVGTGVKNNPILTAYFTYLMTWAVATGGTGMAVARDKDKDDAQTTKTEAQHDTANTSVQPVSVGGVDKHNVIKSWSEIVREMVEKSEKARIKPGTFGAYKAKMQGAMPMIVAELIAMEGVRMKDGLHVVYDDATGRPLKPGDKITGTATIGYGNTVGKDHKPITINTPAITSEEAFDLLKWHLEEKETMLLLYCYDIASKKVDVNSVPEAMGIASVMYNGFNLVIEKSDVNAKNRFARIRKLHEEFGDNLTDEQVLECFKKYPIKRPERVGQHWLNGESKNEIANGLGWFINVKKDGDGIRWRRWLEACIMTGDITPQDLLRIPVNGMGEFFKYVGADRSNWFIVKKNGNKETRRVNKETVIKFKKWLDNPVNRYGKSMAAMPKIGDVMPEDAVAQCMQYDGQMLTDVHQEVAQAKKPVAQRGQKSKHGRIAFDAGARKIQKQNPNARREVLVYGVTKDVNGVA